MPGRTLGAQIAEQIRGLIESGGLPEGSGLPPTRQLAQSLGVSRGVVVDAYERLRAAGFAEATVGGYTRVVTPGPSSVSQRASAGSRPHTWRVDLNPEVPDIATFPRAAWRESLEYGLKSQPTYGLDYRSQRGLPALREALAAHLARSRRLRVEPEDLVLCSGYRQAALILAGALHENGVSTLATPRVGHPVNGVLLPETPLRLRWLDVDTAGLAIESTLDATGTAVMVNPVHQFPLGTRLSAERTQALTASGLWIIEDDSNTLLEHDNTITPALQGTRSDRTIYVGSLSRALAPGIRLGFIVAPPRFDAPQRAPRACGVLRLRRSNKPRSRISSAAERWINTL
ncbi:hypothetical protein GCM10023094_35000 [Rhodococcus olei]|uniref:HTH gntR-type domain-containing protein n=1 Tax=Rhodococcus olei TaxID=2161675 RepID=A0ABP8P998_9NOCA